MREICREFIQSDILGIVPFGDGHINDTYRVTTSDGVYVLQHVRKAIDIGKLEHNYKLYAGACEAAGLYFPTWLKNRAGAYFFADPSGEHWRMYPWIEGEVLEAPLSEEALIACGRGLARMHVCLQTISGEPLATYPMLHDLSHYYDRYLRVVAEAEKPFEAAEGPLAEAQEPLEPAEDPLAAAQEPFKPTRDPSLEKLISERIDDFLSLRLDRSKVIHGDPKLANILFQDGRVKAFLDFDTVMRGSLLEDLTDCIRSCCIQNWKLDQAAAQALIRGYMTEAPDLISDDERQLLLTVVQKLCFELGLRYYTDAIAKEKAFKEKYPGYLLEKAQKCFAML